VRNKKLFKGHFEVDVKISLDKGGRWARSKGYSRAMRRTLGVLKNEQTQNWGGLTRKKSCKNRKGEEKVLMLTANEAGGKNYGMFPTKREFGKSTGVKNSFEGEYKNL